ncbi:MAG: hypothetical protein WCK96_05790 [Methylococcales bacterium]
MNDTKTYTTSNVANANIIQGDDNILTLDNHATNNERELKQALASLRQAIESDQALSQAQRQAAVSDLTSFSEELKKPASEQNIETKNLFWGRLTEVMKFSAALITFSAAVAKLAGFA